MAISRTMSSVEAENRAQPQLLNLDLPAFSDTDLNPADFQDGVSNVGSVWHVLYQ
jgi:hypothetical protein